MIEISSVICFRSREKNISNISLGISSLYIIEQPFIIIEVHGYFTFNLDNHVNYH